MSLSLSTSISCYDDIPSSSQSRLFDDAHGGFHHLDCHRAEDDIQAHHVLLFIFLQKENDANDGSDHEDNIQPVAYLVFAH